MKIHHEAERAHLQQEINALTLIRSHLNFQVEMMGSKAQALLQCHSALIAIDSKHRDSLESFEHKLNALLDAHNTTFSDQLRTIKDTSQRFDALVTDLQALNRHYETIIVHEQAQSSSRTSLNPGFLSSEKEKLADNTHRRFFSKKSALSSLQAEKNILDHAARFMGVLIT
jgi:uncharacterized coiled-coil DUF342 family protein